jgi:hypothetical protein
MTLMMDLEGHTSERLQRFVARARELHAADPDTVQRVARHALQRPQRSPFLASRAATLAGAFVLGALCMWLVQSSARWRARDARADLVSVSFILVADSAHAVALAGDFNDWNPQRTQLQRRSGGVWSVILQLPPGRYNYAFLIDGRIWQPDPNAPPAADEDFGRPSSVMMVHRRS